MIILLFYDDGIYEIIILLSDFLWKILQLRFYSSNDSISGFGRHTATLAVYRTNPRAVGFWKIRREHIELLRNSYCGRNSEKKLRCLSEKMKETSPSQHERIQSLANLDVSTIVKAKTIPQSIVRTTKRFL